MQKPHDDSKMCLAAFEQDRTLVVVVEMSLSSWLVAGLIPGVSREPLKKINPDPERLLQLLYRLQAGSQSHHGVRFSTPP